MSMPPVRRRLQLEVLSHLGLVLVLTVPVHTAQLPLGLRELAAQGNAEAQNEIGSRYYAGRGVPQDDTEAARWIGLAAEQGHAPAQYNLGLLYFRSRGVHGDDAEAATWYRRAAEQGYAPAQGGLGYMFAYGAGVDENHVLAYMWLELARDQQLRVTPVGAWREQPLLARQIVELQIQLGRIVAIGAEGEGLGKDALEPAADVALEAHLPGVEGIGKAERQPQPLAGPGQR